MEGLPVLIQSGDEKYPNMVKVLSAAPHCLVWERDRETDLSSADVAVCLQQDQDKPAACISGSENTFIENRNNCEI